MNRTLIFLFSATCTLLAFIFLVAIIPAPEEVKLTIVFVIGFALGSFGMRT